MKKIASFTINHDTLMPGVYVSRIDGDITTYDMRFVRPNTPPFLPNPVMHTIEHLFATYARNSEVSSGKVLRSSGYPSNTKTKTSRPLLSAANRL